MSRVFPVKASRECISILSSSNGLVCVGIKTCSYDKEYADLMLWNPATRDYKMLSKTSSHKECYKTPESAFGLYYSSFEDDYKLLRVTVSHDIYIYSLKYDSWTNVGSTKDFECTSNWDSNDWMPDVLLNEKFYSFGPSLNQVSHYFVIGLDLENKRFTEIAVPSFENQFRDGACFRIAVLRGCITLCVKYNVSKGYLSTKGFRTIELWTLHGDGYGGWTKMVSYCPKPEFPLYSQPVHLMRNGNWLLHSGFAECVCIVEMEKHTKDGFCSHSAKRMDVPARGKFMETFVSPNQYMK